MMRVFDKFLIGGHWVAPEGSGSFDVIDAATEEPMGRIPAGDAADVDKAVRAARGAFEDWAATDPKDRAEILSAISRGMLARKDELVDLIIGELGSPKLLTSMYMVSFPASTIAFYAKLLQDYRFEETLGNSLVVKEPVGVVAAITPWNYPLHQIVAKVGPALAAGCTVVLKPPTETPLSCYVFAEIVHASGIPDGVFNFVTGAGSVIGEALAAHPDVDMVSFTGSTQAGRRVAEVAARTVKKVSLELGGKAANVILDDADFEKAVRAGVAHSYINCGQTCAAWTRMLVPKSRHDEAVAIAQDEVRNFTVGDPRSEANRLGPVVSEKQRESVRGYIRKGIAEGAQLVAGGAEPPEGLTRGYYMRPTIFAGVTNEMAIAQEEIFGPVLTIMPYEDESDAIRIANGT
ncbi:MAG: aldehyde dehydrogenase family protein, partial [Myxococcales bacterium]|nr:aldehyde dehydrogenase family protein [Myxococcales bacterium]